MEELGVKDDERNEIMSLLRLREYLERVKILLAIQEAFKNEMS
jgi:hypothetical protein